VKSRRLSLAVSSGLLCIGVPFGANAAEPEKPVTEAAPASVVEGKRVAAVEQPTGAPAVAADKADPKNEVWEDAWLPWDTGEEFAGLGFAVFGHLGFGHRFNDPPAGAGVVEAANGLRVGATAIFRPIRWFGFGIGFEHSDLDRDRLDSSNDGVDTFSTTFRDQNTMWIDARAYPLRVDPFALYINIAGGPSWQSVENNSTSTALNSGDASPSQRCEGSDTAGMGMKAAVGAELALVSGAILWAEGGPDYYLLGDDLLDGCGVGAGNAALLGIRAGFAIGFEKSKILKEQEEVKPKDDDLDTIINEQDACPTVAGVPNADPTKNGCPAPKDQDGDGIVDELDACPTVAGVASADPKLNGCPLPKDRDNDGIVDDVDACPDLAGVASTDPAQNGCPPDTDGDGFRDDQDACPQEKGVDDPDPTKRGCPKLVRVTEKEIIILEQVQFDTGKATIKAVSDPLLDGVAAVMKEHPEILKIEVQGHTDTTGTKAINTKLSDDRAKSVRDALVKRGVDAGRFVAKGYGPDVPIGDNKTPEGKQKNRRVQFIVLEKKPKPPVMVPAPPPGATQPPPAAQPGATQPPPVAPGANP
jgi:OmpA-OmpF porin, OOP family